MFLSCPQSFNYVWFTTRDVMVCALALMMKIRREVVGFEEPKKLKTVTLGINSLQQEVGRCFHHGHNYEVRPEEASKSKVFHRRRWTWRSEGCNWFPGAGECHSGEDIGEWDEVGLPFW
jgi:hypothetical protein